MAHAPGNSQSSLLSPHDDLPSASTSVGNLGVPVTFLTGDFAGRTIRAELKEIQQAQVGRKYFKKDRRPLDPPPTCRLDLYLVQDLGTSAESHTRIENYGDVRPEGWVCHADLFSASSLTPSILPPMSVTASPSTIASMREGASSLLPSSSDTGIPGSIIAEAEVVTASNTEAIEPPSAPAPDIVDTLDETEHSTPDLAEASGLAGSTFTQAVKISIDGAKALVFTFTDLSSKLEGTFRLRYQCFNLMSVAAGDVQRPVLAECMGGSFQVYSTKAFPGLGPTTELTKALSGSGIRVNKRETVRKSALERHQEDDVSP